MKNDKPNYTEIENLSAYLDHELSEVEENQLRARLAHDAELRSQLEDLRLTRYTLRHTPKVRRQRNFTLSAEVVNKQKIAWRAVNFSRMISAAASVLFVLVLGGEILLSGSLGRLAAAPAEDAALMQDSAVEADPMMAMEVPAEELEMESMAAAPAAEEAAQDEAAEMMQEPGTGMGGGIEPTPALTGTQAPPAAAEIQETPEPGGGGGATSTPWGIGGGAPPTETPLPAAPTPTTLAEQSRLAPSEKNLNQTTQAEGELAADGTLAEFAPEPEQETRQIPWLRWVQAGLLLLALLSSAAALYFRRSFR